MAELHDRSNVPRDMQAFVEILSMNMYWGYNKELDICAMWTTNETKPRLNVKCDEMKGHVWRGNRRKRK
jgi:hypothetical protein